MNFFKIYKLLLFSLLIAFAPINANYDDENNEKDLQGSFLLGIGSCLIYYKALDHDFFYKKPFRFNALIATLFAANLYNIFRKKDAWPRITMTGLGALMVFGVIQSEPYVNSPFYK